MSPSPFHSWFHRNRRNQHTWCDRMNREKAIPCIVVPSPIYVILYVPSVSTYFNIRQQVRRPLCIPYTPHRIKGIKSRLAKSDGSSGTLCRISLVNFRIRENVWERENKVCSRHVCPYVRQGWGEVGWKGEPRKVAGPQIHLEYSMGGHIPCRNVRIRT